MITIPLYSTIIMSTLDHHTLFIDNGAFEIRAILDQTKVLPTQPNIAYRLPSISSADQQNNRPDGSNALSSLSSLTSALNPTTTNSKFAVGDEIYKLPFSLLCRCRGRRPLGLHSILVDAGLQARIWKHLIYTVAGLLSEENVDLVVTIQPGTPKESMVLWYTLCFIFFKFKSVTFVSSGWVRYLGSNKLRNEEDNDVKKKTEEENNNKKKPAKKKANDETKQESTPKKSGISFVLDVGFSGINCFPVINGLPRRRGFIQQHLGLSHVAKFLARLISFTQMDIVRGGTPELLVQKGIMEKCLQVVSASDSIHEHLMKWETAWLKLSSSLMSDEHVRQLSRKDVLFQGSLRRRLRSRDVRGNHDDDKYNNCDDEIQTMWYSLPSYDDESSTTTNNKKSRANNQFSRSSSSATVASTMFGKTVVNRFGDESKEAKEGDFESESDDDDSDEDGNNNNNAEPDDTVLRLDHERFIAAEILFHPRQIIGEAQGGRLTAAFGSQHSLIGVLPNSNNIASSSSLVNEFSGGCLEALQQSQNRFGPSGILIISGSGNNNNNSIICCGGGAKIRGFEKRLQNEMKGEELNLDVLNSEAQDFVALCTACSEVLFSSSPSVLSSSSSSSSSATITKYLQSCKVERAEDIESLFKTANTPSQRKAAHENAVEVMFRAMQNILQ